MAYPLPADIPLQHIQPTKIDNFTLLLQRFVAEEVAQGGRDRGPTEYQAYTELLTCFNNRQGPIQKNLSAALAAIEKRQQDQRQSMKTLGYHCSEPLTLAVGWRFTSGLGTASVFNVGFTVHRTFGFPYVPGSSLKGMVRHYVMKMHVAAPLGVPAAEVTLLQDWGKVRSWKQRHAPTALEHLEIVLATLPRAPQMLSKEEHKAAQAALEALQAELRNPARENQPLYPLLREDAPVLGYTLEEVWHGVPAHHFEGCAAFCQVFGSTARRGGALFFDMHPAADSLVQLDLDVMNPHYAQYYTNLQPPADYQGPVPIYFLTVRQGVQFRTWFAAKDAAFLDRLVRRSPAGIWEGWVPEAVEGWGIGSKTHAGYGQLLPLKPTTPTTNTPGGRTATEIPFLLEDAVLPEVRAVQQIPSNRVAGEIAVHVEKLKAMTNPIHQHQLAQAIVAKIEASTWRREARKRPWFPEVQRLASGPPA